MRDDASKLAEEIQAAYEGDLPTKTVALTDMTDHWEARLRSALAQARGEGRREGLREALGGPGEERPALSDRGQGHAAPRAPNRGGGRMSHTAYCPECDRSLGLAKRRGAERDTLARRVEELEARERHFAKALGVADGGQYRNDWDAAIRGLIEDRDALLALGRAAVLSVECGECTWNLMKAVDALPARVRERLEGES